MASVCGLRWRDQGKTGPRGLGFAAERCGVYTRTASLRIHASTVCLDTRFPRLSNTKQTSAQPVESAGKDRPGGSLIHLDFRHYHEDGNNTDDTGRLWISKELRFQTLHASCTWELITLTTPHLGPRATAARLRRVCILRRVKGRLEMVWASQSIEQTRHVSHGMFANRGW